MYEQLESSLIDYMINYKCIEDEQIIDNELNNIIKVAEDIRKGLKYKGGAYYPIEDLFINYKELEQYIKNFVMDALKPLGIEFFHNDLYRVCD